MFQVYKNIISLKVLQLEFQFKKIIQVFLITRPYSAGILDSNDRHHYYGCMHQQQQNNLHPQR